MAWQRPGWTVELWGNRNACGLNVNGGRVFAVCFQWVRPVFLRWRVGGAVSWL